MNPSTFTRQLSRLWTVLQRRETRPAPPGTGYFEPPNFGTPGRSQPPTTASLPVAAQPLELVPGQEDSGPGENRRSPTSPCPVPPAAPQRPTELQASELRLRLALQAGGLGAFEDIVAENRLLVSPEFCRIFGLPQQIYLAYDVWAEQLHPDDRRRVLAGVQRMRRKHTPFDLEHRLKLSDGTVRWVRVMANPVVADGAVAQVYGVVQEITDRKQTESALRQYSHVVEQSPASVVITDRQGRIEYVNPKFCELTGYSRAEVYGQNPRLLKSGEMHDDAYRQMWATIIAGGVWRGEFHNRKKSGVMYWESAAISPVRDSGGKITQFIAIKEDITARKRAEQQLAESKQFLERILNTVGEPVFVKDRYHRFIVANTAHCSLLGRERHELFGKTVRDVLPPAEAEALLAADEQVFKTERESLREETITDPAGNQVTLLTRRNVYRNEDGELFLVGVRRDITRHKKEETVLWESDHRQKAILDNIPDPAWLKDAEGRLLVVNKAMQAAAREFGLSFANTTGKTVADLAPECAAEFFQGDQEVFRTGQPVRHEFCRRDPAGAHRWFEVIKSPIFDARGVVTRLAGVAHDITHHKQTESALRQFSSAIEQSPVSVVITNLQGAIEYVNPKFCAVTGYTFAEVRGKNPRLLKSGDMRSAAYQELWAAITAGGEWHGEFHNRKKNGELFWESASISPVRDAAGNITHFIALLEDVTARKLAELERFDSEKFLDQIINTVGDPIFVLDREHRWVETNQANRAVLHRERHEILGQSARDLFPKAVADTLWALDEAVLSTGEETLSEDHLTDDTGRVRIFRARRTRFRNEQGELFLVGSLHDITECKELEAALRESARHQKAILDNIPDPIWLKDACGRYLAVNQPMARFCDQTPELITGKTTTEVFPQFAAELLAADREAVSSRQAGRTEHCLRDATGRAHWFEIIKSPIFDEQGRLTGMAGSARDITERKQTETTLRQFSRAIEQSPASVVITDLQGAIEYVNPKFSAVTGYTFDEVRGKNPRVLKSGEMPAEAYRQMWVTLAAGGEWKGEFHNRKKSGELYWESASLSPIRDAGGKITHYIAVKEDITARKQADAAQKEQLALREWLAKIAANTPGMLYSYRLRPDGTTCFPYISPTVEAFCGVRAEDLLSDATPLLNLIAPDQRAGVRESRKESARKVRPWRAEFQMRHPRKGVIWVEAQSTPEREADGGILWHGFMSDITARREAEASLRESEAKFRQLADNITDAFWITSTDLTTMDYVSAGYELIWGRTRESLRARPEQWLEAIRPADRERVSAAFATLLHGEPAVSVEYQITRPDGSLRWIHDRGFPVRDAAGHLVRIAGLASDITERKRLETQMEQLRQEQELILNNLSEGLHWVGVDGRIRFENTAAAQMLGYDISELIGRPAHETMHHARADGSPYPKGECPIYATLRDHTLRHVTEEVFWRKDGTAIPVEYTCAPVFTKDGQAGGTVVIFTDLSARRQAQAELAKMEREAAEHKLVEENSRRELERQRELNQIKSRFVSLVSHEFRTPLCAINMAAFMLSDYAERMSVAERGEQARDIQHAVGRMTAMLEDFLVHDKIQTGKLECKPGRMNLEVFCRNLIPEVVKPLDPARVIECVVDPAVREACLDEKILRHILANLLSNAVKYSAPGQPVTLELKRVAGPARRADVGEDFLQLKISDSGIGIPPADLAKLYQTFHRAANVGNRPGTGMGLAIVKQFVDLCGGTIQVSSVEGKGTTFYVALPFGEVVGDRLTVSIPAGPVPPPGGVPATPAPGQGTPPAKGDAAPFVPPPTGKLSDS